MKIYGVYRQDYPEDPVLVSYHKSKETAQAKIDECLAKDRAEFYAQASNEGQDFEDYADYFAILETTLYD